jgi:hypothetical protein
MIISDSEDSDSADAVPGRGGGYVTLLEAETEASHGHRAVESQQSR